MLIDVDLFDEDHYRSSRSVACLNGARLERSLRSRRREGKTAISSIRFKEPACRGSLGIADSSDLAKNQKHDNDQEEQPQSSGREIAPTPAMVPSGQSAKKRQDKNHNQNRSQHVSPLVQLRNIWTN